MNWNFFLLFVKIYLVENGKSFVNNVCRECKFEIECFFVIC